MTTTDRVDLDQLDAALRDARAPFEPIPLTPTTGDAHVMTFPTDDVADLPLEALVDVVAGAIEDAGVLIDTLPNLRHQLRPNADTYAYDVHQRAAYIAAEDRAREAWNALMQAQQLIKGLAR